MVNQIILKPNDPNARLTDALVTSLRRRQIVGSRNVALATAALIQNIVRSVKYSTIDELLGLIKAIGRRLVEANPRAHLAELAAGNIVRRILRLIREEYRAAAAASAAQRSGSGPPSAPETPYMGPTTPGLHAPSNHYLSNATEFNFSSMSISPALNRQTSLSNFVAMRHSRAQLERGGSLVGAPGPAGPGTGVGVGVGLGFAGGVGEGLSASTSALFTPLDMPPTPGIGLPSSSGAPTRSSTGGFTSPPTASGSRRDSMEDLSASTGSVTFASQVQILNQGHGHGQGQGQGQGYSSPRSESEDFMRQSGRLKPVLVQAIEEVVGELETTHEDVAKGAREHVHSSEVILTMGHSKTVEAFLKQAFKDRKFTVIVAESAPSYLGHSLATSLSAASIPTILIPDSSIHALIPRCTKLIIGAHTVLANGGLFSLSGSLAAVLAARAHSKPVVVTTGQFKFAPAWNLYHDYQAVDFQTPGNVVGFGGDGGGGGVEGVEVVAPYYDYIRPELINLFVTNEGDHSPSYIYRLIKEAYDDEDVEL